MIRLPSTCGERDLSILVESLVVHDDRNEISLNFQDVTFYSQGPLVALIAKIHQWRSQGKTINLHNAEQSSAFRYLQRMDFFKHCGVSLSESFTRHDASSRFLTITPILGGESEVDKIALRIADCISPWEDAESPESDAWAIIVYCFTEIANNAVQHSGGAAFAAAQFVPKRNMVTAAIADNGMGILNSFLNAGIGSSLDDSGAIELAFKYRVSSKGSSVAGLIGEPRNAGVGLTILRELLRLSHGTLTLISGDSCYRLTSDGIELWKTMTRPFTGTICCVEFKRGQTATLEKLRHYWNLSTPNHSAGVACNTC